jgi:hypothetical protein
MHVLRVLALDALHGSRRIFRYAPLNLTEALLAPASRMASVPNVGGDDTLQVRITVGFEIVR